MQSPEKRKAIRRAITYPAFLDLGADLPARECTLCDASQEGAQIAVADPNSLPDEFILALSSDGAARRRCRVVWRTESQVGVEFLRDRKEGRKPARIATGLPESAAAQLTEAEPAADRVDIDTLTPR